MEDRGLGSLIFYVILGIIAIAGSFQGKNKKQKTAPPAPPKKVAPQRPATETWRPTPRQQPAPAYKKPEYRPVDPSLEGRYEEPMAAEFSSEGSYSPAMAEAFGGEGSINDSMAAAFAMEGVSALHDVHPGQFIHTEISDSEIGDAPEYDYNSGPAGDILDEEFDIKKALIYSAILNRKEYSA